MKKTILRSILTIASLLIATSAFAGLLSPGTIYSIGSTTSTTFKTSPKVSIYLDITANSAAVGTWNGKSWHATAIGKKIGRIWGVNSDDPGTYYTENPTAAPTSATLAEIQAMTQEK